MKKKLLSKLAIATCFVMGMGMVVGCGGGEDNSSNGGSGGNSGNGGNGGNGSPTVQQQIYDEVLNALDATKAYTGAYTVTGEDESVYYGQSYSAVLSMSADPVSKKLYTNTKEENTYGTRTVVREMVDKVFMQDDQYYMYDLYKSFELNSSSEPRMEEDYAKVAATNIGGILQEYSLLALLETIERQMESVGMVKGISVGETNAAWAEVIAGSKAQIAAGKNDPDSEWYQIEADGNVAISCEEKDGTYSVSFAMDIDVSTPERGEKSNSVMTIEAKDGKISLISLISTDEDFEYVANSETSELEKDENAESETMLYKISYAFDQSGYDAIVTTLPDEVEEYTPSDSVEKEITMVANGVAIDDYWAYGETVEDALDRLVRSWLFSNMNVVLYTDEACTKALNIASVTKEQFNAMDTLYAKVTAKEGYVLIKTTEKFEFGADVPEGYKTVFGFIEVEDDVIWGSETFDVEALYKERLCEYLYEEDAKMTINGTEITSAEQLQQYLSAQADTVELYDVKYVYTTTKADLNFFMLFL